MDITVICGKNMPVRDSRYSNKLFGNRSPECALVGAESRSSYFDVSQVLQRPEILMIQGCAFLLSNGRIESAIFIFWNRKNLFETNIARKTHCFGLFPV